MMFFPHDVEGNYKIMLEYSINNNGELTSVS